MANKTIFGSGSASAADAVNEAGGLAYKLEPKHALAQIAATGTFGNTYYSDASQQLKDVLELIETIDDNEYLRSWRFTLEKRPS